MGLFEIQYTRQILGFVLIPRYHHVAVEALGGAWEYAQNVALYSRRNPELDSEIINNLHLLHGSRRLTWE
jgi:hypothetical protein